MTPENFCYWLQGFFEISNSPILTEAQVKMIRQHLALVFNKVTPPNQQVVTLPTIWSVPPNPMGPPLIDTKCQGVTLQGDKLNWPHFSIPPGVSC